MSAAMAVTDIPQMVDRARHTAGALVIDFLVTLAVPIVTFAGVCLRGRRSISRSWFL